MKLVFLRIYLFLFILILLFSFKPLRLKSQIIPVSFSELQVDGELKTRILKNFSRLEERKYQPANVFLTEKQSGNWPGDTEGRTILGLVMDAQSGHCSPQYLEEIINLIPKKLNAKGYMGKIYPAGIMDEQQLSGNGWMIRGLCEYYKWKKDKKVLKIIKSIANNLFVSGKGCYKLYPIDPMSRTKDVGEAIGTVDKTVDNWKLSTDIGCVFIGLDGAIHAYKIAPSKALKEVIDEMINRFLEVDLISIKAQTHATLTAMRGLLTYAEITGDKRLINAVIQRWELYKAYGMTENFGNYNWFTRYNAATEPCAIVDSYMVASQLWSLTQDPKYLSELDLIYYNALCHGQRENGGFGCDKFPNSDINSLIVNIPEAHWCCTMRGAEGLSKVAESAYYTQKDTAYIVHYLSSTATLHFTKNSFITFKQTTAYPFSDGVTLTLSKTKKARNIVLKFNALNQWTDNLKVLINGQEQQVKIEKGFVQVSKNWKENDEIKLLYDTKIRIEKPINKEKYSDDFRKAFYGPFLLCYSGNEQIKINDTTKIKKVSVDMFEIENSNAKLSFLYHLLSPDVLKKDYKKQIVFPIQ